jgi:hypothetical protein
MSKPKVVASPSEVLKRDTLRWIRAINLGMKVRDAVSSLWSYTCVRVQLVDHEQESMTLSSLSDGVAKQYVRFAKNGSEFPGWKTTPRGRELLADSNAEFRAMCKFLRNITGPNTKDALQNAQFRSRSLFERLLMFLLEEFHDDAVVREMLRMSTADDTSWKMSGTTPLMILFHKTLVRIMRYYDVDDARRCTLRAYIQLVAAIGDGIHEGLHAWIAVDGVKTARRIMRLTFMISGLPLIMRFAPASRHANATYGALNERAYTAECDRDDEHAAVWCSFAHHPCEVYGALVQSRDLRVITADQFPPPPISEIRNAT